MVPATFLVTSTTAFERQARAISKHDTSVAAALDELLEVLSQDPHNRSGRYKIKKLSGLKAGEGQWRIRWQNYRLRYDILGDAVVLHSFRHRKNAY